MKLPGLMYGSFVELEASVQLQKGFIEDWKCALYREKDEHEKTIRDLEKLQKFLREGAEDAR